MFGSAVFVPYVKSIGLNDILIAAPDVGSTKRARFYAQQLNCEMVICDKYRKRHNEIAEMNVIGDVDGKTAIILDDMIDTAGTLTEAAQAIAQHGAKSVYAAATHGVLSGPAVERIKNSALQKVIITDTITMSAEAAACSKIVQLSVADLLAEAIHRIHNHDSVSSLFI
ncbi:ribose-phosphate diphosphokinase [bacterium]|nr:ribose-phosphate diphosphokinase [bacterium]